MSSQTWIYSSKLLYITYLDVKRKYLLSAVSNVDQFQLIFCVCYCEPWTWVVILGLIDGLKEEIWILWHSDSPRAPGWLSDLTADVCFWPGCHCSSIIVAIITSSARVNKNKIGCRDAEKYFTAPGNLHKVSHLVKYTDTWSSTAEKHQLDLSPGRETGVILSFSKSGHWWSSGNLVLFGTKNILISSV